MKTINDLTDEQQARALRLLAEAEQDDVVRQIQETEQVQRDNISAVREMEKEELAADWTRRFRAVGWNVDCRVQTTRWKDGIAEPEVWVQVLDREAGWARLLELLETNERNNR